MIYENRLSVLRRTWALTQQELGDLVGFSADIISNYERLVSEPAVAAMIGFELVFDKALTDIFPHTTSVVAQRMLNALAELSIEVEGNEDKESLLKQALIDQISERLDRIIPAA